MKITLSSLPKLWIFDMDGTLVVHNGYRQGGDRLLDGVREVFARIAPEDHILILTAREEAYRDSTEEFLRGHGIRFDVLLCGMPLGERILVNDNKPSGLKMAFAIDKKRDAALDIQIIVDKTL